MAPSNNTPEQADQTASPQNGPLVLHTKMCKPPIGENMIIRQSIIDHLESKLTLPMTLISANTGCGKSVIASQWMDQTYYKYGWLSLDEEHNNPEVLLAYILASFKANWPSRTFGIAYLKNATRLPASVLASTLIKDLDELGEPFTLVLDDYHVIRKDIIHEIFNVILRYPPAQFHLVIITQIDPPLRLARLRAQFRLNELRMKELAFTYEDALGLRTLLSRGIADEDVSAILEYAEGWAAGLIAGLMGLAEGVAIEKVVQALDNKGSIISELLDEVVINGLPTRTIKYLALTALMDRYSENLLKRMIDEIGDHDLSELSPEEIIGNSRRKNLFLISLDSTGEWYRYHHFFKNQIEHLIESTFSDDEVKILLKSASRWFLEHELWEEALTYAIRSNDMDFAIDIFSSFRHSLLNSEQLKRLERLTHQFPEDVCRIHPELLINLAMLQHYNANYVGMQQYLSMANNLLVDAKSVNTSEKQLLGEYHGVSTYLSYMLGEFEQAVFHGEQCMQYLPADQPNFFREQSVGWYAFAQQTCGNASIGRERLESEYKSLANRKPYFRMRLLQGILIFDLFEGNASHLYIDGLSLVRLSSPVTYPGSWAIGVYCMVYDSYVHNHLNKVFEFHTDIRLHRYAGRPFWVMHHFFIEGLAGIANGSWKQVEHCIKECEELADELNIEALRGMIKSFQVEYYLRRNEVDRALEHAALANFEPQPPTFFLYIPQLTRVKLYFQTQRKESAQRLLDSLVASGRRHHNNNLLVQALALQAAASSDDGNNSKAHQSLRELLTLTQKNGNIRAFLDIGLPMEKALRQIKKSSPYHEQVVKILLAFETEKKRLRLTENHQKDLDQLNLIKLSRRETEILALVMQGYKNEEIALKLFISLDTVKKHLYRAYQKLDVTNRVNAIKKIQSLGLIPSH